MPEPEPGPEVIEDDEDQKDEDENGDEDSLGGGERGETGRKRADAAKSRDELRSSVAMRDLLRECRESLRSLSVLSNTQASAVLCSLKEHTSGSAFPSSSSYTDSFPVTSRTSSWLSLHLT